MALLATAVAAIVVVAVVFAVLGIHHKTSSSTTSDAVVLIPSGTLDAIPAEQLDAAQFQVSSPHVVNGTFDVEYWIQIYLLTPSELLNLTVYDKLTGYTWASGNIPNDTVEHLNLVVQAGDWDLTFYDPSTTIATAIGFWTNLTLTPT